MQNSFNAPYARWKVLSAEKTNEIRRFYKNRNPTIFTAVNIIKDNIFHTDPEYVWCAEGNEGSYKDGLGKHLQSIKSQKNGKKCSGSKPGLFSIFKDYDFGSMEENIDLSQNQLNKKNEKKIDASALSNIKELSNDVDYIVWMRNIMKKALDYYYMFGMCPFRMIVGSNKNPKLVIPSMEEGLFIARINPENSLKEIKWMSNNSLVNISKNIEPDEHVGVYCWAGYEPELDVGHYMMPFTSTVARLVGPYKEYKKFVRNAHIADDLASRPVVLTVSKENKRTLADMTMEEQLGDAIVYNPEGYSISDAEQVRINRSSMRNTDMIDQIKTSQGTNGPLGYGVFHDDEVVVDYGPNPWTNRTYPLDNGRSPASLPMPHTRNDLHILHQEFEKKVSQVMRVPFDLISGSQKGNKTSAESESANRVFRDAVWSARDVVTEFVEEAWAQAMGKFEEEILVEGIESVMMNMEKDDSSKNMDNFLEQNGVMDVQNKNKRQKIASNLASETNERGGAVIPTPKKVLKKIKEKRYELGQPVETNSKEEQARVMIETQKSAVAKGIYDTLIKRAQSKGILVNSQLLYKGVSNIVTDNFVNPVQNENEKYNDVVEKKTRQKIRKQQLKTEGYARIDKDLENPHFYDQENDLSGNGYKIQQKVRLLRNLQMRKRLTVQWSVPPVMDTADIAFFQEKGILDISVSNALSKMQYKLPMDTPSGEIKEIRIMREQARIKREEQAYAFELSQKAEQRKEKRQDKLLKKQEKIQQETMKNSQDINVPLEELQIPSDEKTDKKGKDKLKQKEKENLKKK